MPARRAGGKAVSSQNLTMVYGAVANDLMQRLGDSQAAQMGPPTSSEDKVKPATNADRVEAWNARNPEATDDAMMRMAMQKYQEHIAGGMPPDKAQRATAEDLTHFRYGQRLKIYTYGTVGFREQVEAAERMAKIAARESTPDPPPPSPTMPSAALTNLTTLGAASRQASVPTGASAPTVAPLDAAAGEAGAVLGQPTGAPPLLPAAPLAPNAPPTTPAPPEYPPGGVL